jgi:hypothetical protein
MRRYVTALVLVAAVAATGCGSDEAGSLPPTLPPVATSVTPVATASASAASAAAAIETAARAYFAALADAGQTGDPRRLEKLLAPGCECRKQADYVRREYAAGRTATTTYEVESVKPEDVTADGGTAAVTYSSPRSVVVARSGEKVRTLPALNHVGMAMFFRRVGSTWLIERLVELGGS